MARGKRRKFITSRYDGPIEACDEEAALVAEAGILIERKRPNYD